VVALALALVLGGCTYSRREPGLFGDRPPSPAVSGASSSPERFPEPTNRQLPVLGEQIWTTAEGLDVTVRFAVHAVRRMAGATVLDWSVTPLGGPGLTLGAEVPPEVDLGLGRDDNGDQRIYLIADRRVYRPLAHKHPDVFHHCLCTPLWVAQLSLRIGETRMLQIAFPPLPARVGHVDVSLANTMAFWHIPVMAEGMVPLAARSVDLARPPDPAPALALPRPFTEADEPLGRRRSLGLLDVQSGAGGAVLTWTVGSLDNQPYPAFDFGTPPVSTSYGATAGLRSTDVASGPQLRTPSGTVLKARWITSDEPAPGYLECLCSHFGLWAAGLRTAGGVASVSTTYASLPSGTQRIDVVLPGMGSIRDVPVRQPAIDPDRAMLGVGRVITTTWTYSMWNPSGGWSTGEWPTPLPDPGQLGDYRARVDRIVDLVAPG
jgi:hypothetical protein